jgi:hypothetical protein
MKNIYKLLKGVIVMMIAIAGLIANAGTPLPSSLPGPMYVLYPPTNLNLIPMEVCFAYLSWDKPHDPGGLTPPGLLGYRIYRDGVFIHYTLEYFDYIEEVGMFTDSVTAYYDLTSYGYPGDFGESIAASGIVFVFCGQILPFFEPWNVGSFGFQMWSFSPVQGNWLINTSMGNPIPTASFMGTPSAINYNNRLQNINLDGHPWQCANIYLEYDSRIILNNPTSQEKLITEIYYDYTWYPKDTLLNDAATGWIHHKIDISETADKTFRIGFRATGINSADIGEWDIDNIYVYAVCYKPPDFTANRIGNSVHLSWGIPCTEKKLIPDLDDSSSLIGYNVYRTDDSGLPPFIRINSAFIADTEYTDVLPATFDGVACYNVTAVYQEPYNPGYILCEAHSDTLCEQYLAGIPEQNEAQSRIFPNPVSDVLNIETDQTFTGIEILNFLGEKIYSENFLPTKKVCISMKDFQQGIYLLKIKSVKGLFLRKVIKY